jgi:hypothetical protein
MLRRGLVVAAVASTLLVAAGFLRFSHLHGS